MMVKIYHDNKILKKDLPISRLRLREKIYNLNKINCDKK